MGRLMLSPSARRVVPLVAALALAAALPTPAPARPAGETSGPAQVIDGRTLAVGGVVYRLYGIDAPDLGQDCLIRGRTRRCGNIARTALMDLVAGSTARCAPVAGSVPPRDSAGPILGVCSVGGFDLGANMVHTGWALADPETAPGRYRSVERRSRIKRRGLWQGSFEQPWTWRRRQAAAGKPAADAGPARAPAGGFCIRGRLTGEGVECPALRGDDGKLYTLARPAAGLRRGDRVCVCGRRAQLSSCMQGVTIAASFVGAEGACP